MNARPITRYQVVHRTRYRYGASMTDGYTVAHLLVRDTPSQYVESTVVTTDQELDERHEDIDHFGNRVLRLGVHHPHDSLEVVARSVVRVVAPVLSLEAGDGASWDETAGRLAIARGERARTIAPFVAPTASTPPLDALDELIAEVFTPGRPLVDAVGALSSLIHQRFRFDPAATDVSTPIAEVLAARHGVCQDFAHVMIAALRRLGLAARYVSGYLETLPPPGAPKLVGSDASHAWCSVWSPDVGWFDVDPTNDQLPPQRHVVTAWGRDYLDIPPLRGVVIGPIAAQDLEVGVDVTVLDDMPVLDNGRGLAP